MSHKNSHNQDKIGLFVTCIVDLFRPSVGFASVKLLEEAGYQVNVPMAQTCCGQPAYNSGARDHARDIAKVIIENFEIYDYVVAPSASCAGMLKCHYPTLFEADEGWQKRAKALAEKVYEITDFLLNVAKVESLDSRYDGKIAYHQSCSNMRELNNRIAPEKLLAMVAGAKITPFKERESCCGFGGLFAVKYPDISAAMVEKKAGFIRAVMPDMLVSVDLGCLLNIAGKLSRQGSSIEVRHITELLAGVMGQPDLIGQRTKK